MAEKVIIEIEASTKEAQKNLENLSKSFEDVYGDVKPLSSRVGELEDRLYQMAQAGDTASEEFKNLTKEASRLKTAQKEVDEIMDRSSMTLSQKVSTGLSTVASGAVLATSTMQEFGVIGEDSAQTVNRAIGALSLVEFAKGLNDSTGLFSKLGKKIKSYTVVQKIATWAQRMWNLAMAANPLMTIVVAITAVIAAGYALISMFSSSAEQSEKNTEAIEAQTAAIEEQNKANQERITLLEESIAYEQDLLKAQGADKETLRQKETDGLLRLAKETKRLQKQAIFDLMAAQIMEEFIREDGDDNEIEAAEAQTAKLLGIRDGYTKKHEGYLKSFVNLGKKYTLEDINEQNKDNKNAETNRKNKIAREKELANTLRKLQIENIEDKQERDLKSFDFDAELQRKKLVKQKASDELLLEFDKSTQRKRRKILKDSQDKIDLDEAKAAEDIRKTLIDTEEEKREEEKRLLEKSYNEKLALAMEYYGALSTQAKELEAAKKTALDNQQKKFKEEDAKKAVEESAIASEKLVLEKEDELLSFEAQRELIKEREELLKADKTINDKDRLNLEKQFAAAKIKLDDLTAQASKEKYEKTEKGLNQLSDVVGKNTVAGKGMSIAAATINTYQGVTDALAAKTITPFETALKFVNAGSILANGLKTVKQMASVKIPNASGGAGTGGASSPSGGSISQPPAFNVVGASGTSQLAGAIGSQSKEPTRAYVVSADVTTSQEMDRNTIEGASI
tara:strand:- start:1899 stop:4109 length:2211 start_codon:yes stop_codon:yes gene_type:complete